MLTPAQVRQLPHLCRFLPAAAKFCCGRPVLSRVPLGCLANEATPAAAALSAVSQLCLQPGRHMRSSAAASLEQQEPLAAAGVPEERRQFEVTVANILQVRGWLVVG